MTLSSRLANDCKPYPTAANFGQLLDWHLTVWGTHPGCSTTKPSYRHKLVEFAHRIHLGMPLTADDENPATKLRYWRQGRYLPSNDTVVANIFAELFGDDPTLSVWKADLAGALAREREHKMGRPAPIISENEVTVPKLSPFFSGRETEVNALSSLAGAPSVSAAILILGGPGIGKTEVAKAIAHHPDILKKYGNRRHFISLQAVTSARALQNAIALKLGVDSALGLNAVLDVLKLEPTLLVLDNFETPWDDVSERGPVEFAVKEMAGSGASAVVVSMQGRDLVREAAWSAVHEVQPLSTNQSEHLFAAIAGDWIRHDPLLLNFLEVAGGVPLAIELLGIRAHSYSQLSSLWREWTQNGVELLRSADASEVRGNALAKSIDLALGSRRMNLAAKRLFSVLGELPDGCADEDIRAYLKSEAQTAIEGLLRVGLAYQRSDRLDLLPPVRAHARKWHPPDTGDLVFWSSHYLGTFIREEERILGMCGTSAIKKIRTEFANIEYFVRQSVFKESFSDLVLTWGRLARVCSKLRISPPLIQEAFQVILTKGSNAEIGEAHFALGRIAASIGQTNKAHRHYKIALNIAEAAGDIRNVAVSAIPLILADCKKGKRKRIREIIALIGKDEELESIRADYLRLLAIALPSIARRKIRSLIDEARSIYVKTGDHRREADCQRLTAEIQFREDQSLDAKYNFEGAMLVYEQTGEDLERAHCLAGLGYIAAEEENWDNARTKLELAKRLYNITAYFRGEANVSAALGRLASDEDELDNAILLFRDASRLYLRDGDISESRILGFQIILINVRLLVKSRFPRLYRYLGIYVFSFFRESPAQ